MSEESNVVSTTDVSKKTPQSFNDLKKGELVAAANAFGVDAEGTSASIRAALAEDGVTWEDYKAAFLIDTDEDPAPVEIESEVNTVSESNNVVTVEAQPALAPQDKYLIKMTRENPYFEVGKYKFTQERPYAIMTAAEAQNVLQNEEGFRQAYPDELQEFYS